MVSSLLRGSRVLEIKPTACRNDLDGDASALGVDVVNGMDITGQDSATKSEVTHVFSHVDSARIWKRKTFDDHGRSRPSPTGSDYFSYQACHAYQPTEDRDSSYYNSLILPP